MFGFLGAPATLDPYARSATDLTWYLARPLYPSLFRFDPDGTVVADLAEDIAIDGSTVKITLRDVRWSNGRRIEARDVVASARRAALPSGFAGLEAAVISPRVVRFAGPPGRWRERLATLTFVLPRGRAGRATAGAFRRASYTPGFRLRLAAADDHQPSARLKRLDLVFIEDVPLMLDLLERGGIDAALVPSTVNLDERLSERGIAFDHALGWETLVVDLSPGATTATAAVIERALDRELLSEGLIRDGGVITDSLYPDPGGGSDAQDAAGSPGSVSIAVPEGDELLALIHRALQVGGQARDARIELLEVPAQDLYSDWVHTAQTHGSLARIAGGPWEGDIRRWLDEPIPGLPLFEVATFVAWGHGAAALEVNPTFEGPLWNAHEWYLVEE